MTKYQLWQDENLVGYSRYTRAYFIELVTNDNLPFNDNYHGNSAS